MAGGWTTLLHVFICFFLRNNVLDVEPIYTFRGHRWVLRNLSLIFLTFCHAFPGRLAQRI